MTAKTRQKQERAPRSAVIFAVVGLLVIAASTAAYLLSDRSPPPAPPPQAEPWKPAPDALVYRQYAGSGRCRECHQEAYDLWKNSHHALAERPFVPSEDRRAFDPPREISHGTMESVARVGDDGYELVTEGLEGKQAFELERVIAESPLRQFLVPAPGGRYQVADLAFDPRREDWFNVYGDEDRQPGEWGHWTGRGMTWNSMCAACHNTRLRKNYLPATDSYETAMAEMGVGCESCHGPMREHAQWQTQAAKNPRAPKTADPGLWKMSREQHLDICGSCHSRRGELTGDFRPGDLFGDHHALVIPDETEIYYPDGQVHEEDYEFASFVGSRMHHAGVRCADCHDPHSGKTRFEGNDLCMRCHDGTAVQSPKIDPAAHSFHKMGEPGSLCVDCHMPQTVYMQRHWRRDHGFTIPDPLLTQELGIPNACNRCHKDQTTEWSIEWVDKWYGDRMDRPTRDRARAVARAREGDEAVVPELIRLLKEEPVAAWRASAATLLKRWNAEPRVWRALIEATEDEDPLARAMAARALEEAAQEPNHPASEALAGLLDDPVRHVRIEAAWGLRRTVDLESEAGEDLARYLGHNLDQPSGLLQQGVLELDRGDTQQALERFTTAVGWDPNSAPLRDALAVAHSIRGNPRAAVEQLEEAARLAPEEALYRFKLGLAYNEIGEIEKTAEALAKAVELAPDYGQAWYNLGLAYSELQRPMEALDALHRAEAVDRQSARIPYAIGTLFAQLGRTEEARAAAYRALEADPNFPAAVSLLRALPPE